MGNVSVTGKNGRPEPEEYAYRRVRLSASATGRFYLIKDMNCATAALEAAQDVFGLRDDLLLKTATGLEGGVVAGGSTCGVITGGALGLAQLWRERTGQDPRASSDLMAIIADYVRWFDDTVGTTLCRERTGVDFHTTAGLTRYFLPGDRVLRCISHIGKAMMYIQKAGIQMPPLADPGKNERAVTPLHCASAVLTNIRDMTGLGQARIEQGAAVLSGGVGLSGGVCGALAGAIMGINLLVGMDIRQYSRVKVMRDFFAGHINLLIQRPRWMPEPFGIGREIVRLFYQRAGSVQCRHIVGRTFTGLDDFSAHRLTSPTCRDLIGFSSDLASAAIGRWR